MTGAEIREAKAALRAAMLQRRGNLGPGEWSRLSDLAQRHLMACPEFGRARTVAMYWAVRGETGTQEAIQAAVAAGKRVALPRIVRTADGRNMVFHLYAGRPSDLAPGPMGLREPAAAAPVVDPGEMDLVVVPGLAFDRTGGRLGYGGGFYDRFLPGVRPGVPRLGYCFAFQVLDQPVPRAPNDVTVDGLITDAGFWRFPGPEPPLP